MTSETYDIVIVGGGTAGLVLAARLSEDPNIKVLVLEAGEDLTEDQRVLMPPMWHRLIHSEADWNYKTVPQEGLGGRVVGVPQGRLLGGSGAMNGLIFSPPSKAVVEGWANLGNPGWEWDSFVKSFKKAYTLGAANEGEEEKGTLKLNLPDLTDSEWPEVWKQTLGTLGLEQKGDLYGGEVLGHIETADNVDPITMQRSFSGNAYLKPARERENLIIITMALVEKVLFDESEGGDITAKGVQYIKEGEVKKAIATREVILSAGAIHSPKILELSGVGNAQRLKDLGIDIIAENPHVGENLQTHLMLTLTWELRDGLWHMDNLSRQDPAALGAAMEAFAQKKGPLSRSGTNASALLPLPLLDTPEGKADLEELLKAADAPVKSSETPAFSEAFTRIVRSMISSPTEPSGLYMSFPGYAAYNPNGTMGRPPGDGGHFTLALILAHPRSSGNVHISKNSAQEPGLLIDPRYLTSPLDVEVLARHAAFLETIGTTEPLASKLKADGQRYPEAAPSVGKLTDLDTARDFVKRAAVGAHHFVGSCSMMPKDMGGVVDHELRLHGCRNLRVVDASAIPISPSTNPQSTVYGFAEHAANIIKSGLAKA